MNKNAKYLRPVRFLKEDQLRYYDAISFIPSRSYVGCEIYKRRCDAFGMIWEGPIEEAAGLCDILDENGDTIDDFALTRRGLAYLIRVLGCRVIKE